jgi:hypothetical protein
VGINEAAPRVSRIMHTILHRAQQQVGSWVGSSVIHLGDHNVPNALMFIDKVANVFNLVYTNLSNFTANRYDVEKNRYPTISIFISLHQRCI